MYWKQNKLFNKMGNISNYIKMKVYVKNISAKSLSQS